MRLLKRIYIDCEPNSKVRMLDPIFMFSSSPSAPVHKFEIVDHQALRIKGIFDSFPELRPDREYRELKVLVIDALRQEGAFETPNPDKSEFCSALLSVQSCLLSTGKYTHATDENGISTVLYPEGTFQRKLSSEPSVAQIMAPAMRDQLVELIGVIVHLLDTAGQLRSSFAVLTF